MTCYRYSLTKDMKYHLHIIPRHIIPREINYKEDICKIHRKGGGK